MRPAFRLEQPRAHHGRQGQRDQKRQQQGDADGDGEFAEQQPDISAHQEQRNKHRDQRQRDRHDGEADFAGTLQRRFVGRGASLHVPDDVLDHDDGIVDHETHRNRQRHQRQIVEAVAEFVKDTEGADQRQRNGDRRDDRGPEVSQEDEDHHHHQRDREDQRELNVVDGCANRIGAVGDDMDLDGGWDRRLQHRHHRLDPLDRVDDVGAGLALDRHDDRALVVVPAGDQVVFRRADRAADVADADRRAVSVGDHQIGVIVRVQQLVVGVQRIGLARAVERAFRHVDIGLAERRANVFEIDAARGKRLRIELHAHGGLLLAAKADEADARYLRDLLQQDVFRVRIHRGQRQAI